MLIPCVVNNDSNEARPKEEMTDDDIPGWFAKKSATNTILYGMMAIYVLLEHCGLY